MDFFSLFSKKKESSKDIAKKRLQLVLIHDRTEIPAALVEKMKNDIIGCITKYIDIDEAALDIEFTQIDNTGEKPSAALVANIPIKGVKK